MRPKRHETTGSGDLFRARLDQITRCRACAPRSRRHRRRRHTAGARGERQTSAIPIIMASAADPLRTGRKPFSSRGNVTGVSL